MAYRPLPDDRWYSTPTLIREVATFPATVTDMMLRGAIKSFSKALDVVTSQFFWPIANEIFTRGQRDYLVIHPTHVPIIDAISVQYSTKTSKMSVLESEWATILSASGAENWVSIDPSLWQIRDRGVFMGMAKFPEGFGNIKVNGVFGWIENSRGQIETELAAPVTAGDNQIQVVDGSAFRKRDIIDIDGPDDTTPLRVIAEGVSGNIIAVDTIVDPVDAPLGSAVTSWGQVPNLIEIVLGRWLVKLFTVDGGGGGGGPIIPPGAIKRERIDSYEYERFEPDDDEIQGVVTGDSIADRLLQAFTAPPHVGFV